MVKPVPAAHRMTISLTDFCGRGRQTCRCGAVGRISLCNSNTRGEALRCRAKRRQEAREGASPTADHMAAAPCRHRALSRLLTARGGEEASASNLKKPHCVPQAFLQHTGERGAHGGKSEVSPRAPCAWRPKKSKAHSHRLAAANVPLRPNIGLGDCRLSP